MSDIVPMRTAAEQAAIDKMISADFDKFWRDEPSIIGDVISGSRPNGLQEAIGISSPMTSISGYMGISRNGPPLRAPGAARHLPDSDGSWLKARSPRSTERAPLSDSYATRVDDFSWLIPDLGGEDW